MNFLAILDSDDYGYKTSLYQINFKEGEVKGEIRQAKCLKKRQIRLATQKLKELGVLRRLEPSSYDCTGRTFTCGTEIVYTTDNYALVRIDTGMDI
jgi:hypothetical protein